MPRFLAAVEKLYLQVSLFAQNVVQHNFIHLLSTNVKFMKQSFLGEKVLTLYLIFLHLQAFLNGFKA